METSQQQKDEGRKEQIRAAATRCFVRRGFAATRLIDIAREAGLSKGGVYFHYRAKETLFQDIIDAQLRTVAERWSFQPVSDQPADLTLHRLIVAHLRTMEDEPDETRFNYLLVSMALQEEIFREKIEEALRIMRGLYAGVIRRGIREGVFRHRDPEELARGVMAMLQGLGCYCAVAVDGRMPLRPEAAADYVVQMLRPTEVAAPSEGLVEGLSHRMVF